MKRICFLFAGLCAVLSSCATKVDETVNQPVDLGLSVKWASCNLGAKSPEDCGNWYAWGETSTKSDFRWTTYRWATVKDDEITITKYSLVDEWSVIIAGEEYEDSGESGQYDRKTILDNEDDAAYHLSKKWSIPTRDNVAELIENCICELATLNDKPGYRLTSKKNGNSIFLPCSGYIEGEENIGKNPILWLNSIYDSPDAFVLVVDNEPKLQVLERCCGCQIRAVCD